MASTLATLMAEQRRRVMLGVLGEMQSNRANDYVLRVVVERRVDVVDRNLVRADLSYLETHGLITVERLEHDGQDVWIATLTDYGSAVARGLQHQGVAARELG